MTDTLYWEKHISKICRKAYPRVRMLAKLRYVGVSVEDLIVLYSLHIQSVTEYCSTAFHSSFRQKLSKELEAIQKTCQRVTLADMYINYNSALEMYALKSLYDRREQRSLSFSIKLEGTARYAGFTSSSCGELRPPAFYAVLAYFRPFLVFSSNLSNF